MIKYPTAILSALALCGAAPAYADSLVAEMNMLHPDGSDGWIKVKPYATIRFDLSVDGTITGSMHQANGAITNLLYNAVITGDWETKYSISNLTPATSWANYSITAWMHGGFGCGDCGSDVTFTIGKPGDFTSAWQAFDPYHDGVDFYMWGSDGAYYGTAMAVPEPATYGLLLGGLGLLGVAAGRKRIKFS